jgi:uncharacterized membrane protein YhaH (DUF805 family)
MEWYVGVLKNYVGFQGRARRKEYWMFFLFNFIITLLLAIFESTIGLNDIITGIYSLSILLPALAVAVRRLHDIGRSGWWLLIGIIPLVGTIILLILMCQDSQVQHNKYGLYPKA